MGSSCPSATFGDLLSEPLRNGLTRPKRVRGVGVPMVNMGELFGHRRLSTDVDMERVHLNARHPDRDLLEPQDLLFARQSIVADGAGQASIFLDGEEPVTFESHLIRARVDTTRADPRWLFYWFESNAGRALVRSIVNQVAAAGIRGSDLVRLPVPCPDLASQRAAADVLWTLDDKIDSNRRLADAIEALVMAEFHGRFVNFVGRQVWDEDMPVGWRRVALRDIADLHRDFVRGTSELPYLGLDVMPRGSTVLSGWTSTDAPSGHAARFDVGDILFGKLRPYFKKAGVAPIAGRCSTEILVVRPRIDEHYGVVLGHLASDRFIEHCVAVSSGTRMPRAEWKDASTYVIALPPDGVASAFTELARRSYDHIRRLVLEARTLKEIRDELLPKLVSGEIRVPPDNDEGAPVELVS